MTNTARLIGIVVFCPLVVSAGERIHFNDLTPGQIVSVINVPGIGSVEVFGANPDQPGINHAVIFDSSNPTGGDLDLGSPNETCGGPGVSTDGAGELDGAHPNCLAPDGPLEEPLGNVLIVAENLVDNDGDGFVDDPDDEDADGRLIVVFPIPVTFEAITLLDIQASEDELADVRLFSDPEGMIELLASPVELTEMGDNGLAVFEFPTDVFEFRSVRMMSVRLKGSGAIDNIVLGFCGDGVLDPGEDCDGEVNADVCGEDCVPTTLTFEELLPGQVVSEISVPGLTVGVEALRSDADGNHAVVFDSANLNPDPDDPGAFIDEDLGSPNETCGGPGVSDDGSGEADGSHPNCDPLGNVLIVARNLVDDDGDDLVDLPNDFDGPGRFTLTFDVPVIVHGLTMMDIESSEGESAEVLFFVDEQGFDLAALSAVPSQGDNGAAVVEFEETESIVRMEIVVDGSSAIDNIHLSVCTPKGCPADCSCSEPICGDGVIDPGEECDGNATGGACLVPKQASF